MIRLDTANKSLVAYTDATATTAEPQFVTSWDDIDTSLVTMTPGSGDGLLNGTTPVTVIPASATARNAKYVGIYNADTVQHNVYILLLDTATYRMLFSCVLQPGETVVYNDGAGWKVFNEAGALKTVGLSGFSGQSGFSGFSGNDGQSGFSGFSGNDGQSGFSGDSTSGFSGFSGNDGQSGLSGFSGNSTSGFSGFSGNSTSGFSGQSGLSGFSGQSGLSGFSGFSGQTGLSGLSGFSGFSGQSGLSGNSTSGFSGHSGIGISGLSGFSGNEAGILAMIINSLGL